jgi:hypothetical protein
MAQCCRLITNTIYLEVVEITPKISVRRLVIVPTATLKVLDAINSIVGRLDIEHCNIRKIWVIIQLFDDVVTKTTRSVDHKHGIVES